MSSAMRSYGVTSGSLFLLMHVGCWFGPPNAEDFAGSGSSDPTTTAFGTMTDTGECIDGEIQPCFTADPLLEGVGECVEGTQACVDGSWDVCDGEVLPEREICNSLDDDCDGEVDEDFGEVTCGKGICMVTIDICTDGVPETCTPGRSQAEECNGFDDDCNGMIDDDLTCECFDDETQDCYSGPMGTEHVGICVMGTQICTDGLWGMCMGDQTPLPELCDGVDNNCDGVIDEDNPEGDANCSTGGLGVCAAGTTECSAGILLCNQDIPLSPELCDGIDNDCDGAIDNGDPGGGGFCNTGELGVCLAGTEQCAGGSIICIQDVPMSTEICDDLDNDCDGVIDNGDPGGGGFCNTGELGVCLAGTEQCAGGSIICIQDVPMSTEICDDLDNDCDGIIDNGDPGGGGFCNTGEPGVCLAGTEQCAGGSIICIQDVPDVGGDLRRP